MGLGVGGRAGEGVLTGWNHMVGQDPEPLERSDPALRSPHSPGPAWSRSRGFSTHWDQVECEVTLCAVGCPSALGC